MRDRLHDIVMAGLLRADQSYAAELRTDVHLNNDFAELAGPSIAPDENGVQTGRVESCQCADNLLLT